jgi:hypothetical protein
MAIPAFIMWVEMIQQILFIKLQRVDKKYFVKFLINLGYEQI